MLTTDNLIRGLLGANTFAETRRDHPLQTIKDNAGLTNFSSITFVKVAFLAHSSCLAEKLFSFNPMQSLPLSIK